LLRDVKALAPRNQRDVSFARGSDLTFNSRLPGEGRDPFLGARDAICLSSGEQTLRYAVCRQHDRSRAPRVRNKNKAMPGFTAKYGVDRLVWYEAHEMLETAWAREHQIKEWKREWKIAMIERENPHWVDLYPSLSPP
jgi:predicted GIY-YIG superfamily endonuclease